MTLILMGITYAVIIHTLCMSTVCSLNKFSHIRSLRSNVEPHVQQKTVEKMLLRLIRSRANEFIITIDPTIFNKTDSFQLISKDSQLHILADSGVSAAWGFHFFLVQYCHCHVSWGGNQLKIPKPLPRLPSPGITIPANDQFRYYANVVTFSYSFVWWDWERWEQEIDWMALNGINLPLAFTGQEWIWFQLYKSLGLAEADILAHFGGAAFLAWSRMGNLRLWGGPLPLNWIERQSSLQKRILGRMRDFGMLPVLPAFAGHVPESFIKIFPNASVSRLSNWSKFNCTYSCSYLLDFDDPLFTKIGEKFINLILKYYGSDHIYNCDSFNEMTPKSSNPEYIQKAGEAVYKSMLSADSKAVWLMQGWIFSSNKAFWKRPQAKALLTSVPLGRMVVLDLIAELLPQWKYLDSFYGQPFIWCLLNNFGGTIGLYGRLQSMNQNPLLARSAANSTMIGIGLTMEGIFQNDLVFQFMLENTWRKAPRNIDKWVHGFITQRYGVAHYKASKAWQILSQGVLNCTDKIRHHGKYIITKRPRLNMRPEIWYKAKDVFQSWSYLLNSSKDLNHSSLYRYDLVDVTRQALQVIGIRFYADIMKAVNSKNVSMLRLAGKHMVDLLSDLDEVLSTDAHFLLGQWLKNAKKQSNSEKEKRLFEFNARNQITLWGPNGEIKDYATKHWSGIVKDYYRPRWQLFVKYLELAIDEGKKFDKTKFDEDVFNSVEMPFTMSRRDYPSEPIGDSSELSLSLHKKYNSVMNGKTSRRFYRKILHIYYVTYYKTSKSRRKRYRNLYRWMTRHAF